MSVLSQIRFIAIPTALLKTVVLSTAVVSTVILSGCASKPQVNNATRFAKAPDYYTVRSGDTLSGIATRYGLSYTSVADMNDIAAPYRIYVGQSLRLKGAYNHDATYYTNRSNSTSKCWSPESKYDHHNHNNSC